MTLRHRIKMPQEREDRDGLDDVLSAKHVISEDINMSSCNTENEESGCDVLKKDNISQIADENAIGSSLPEDMIILDTTAESSQEEIDGSSYELPMPEGVCLDTDGGETSAVKDVVNESQTPLDVVPSYDTDFAGVLTDIEYSMLTGKKINDARRRKQCFNCLGDHNLNECLDPQDAARIAANRKKYMNTRVSNVRYHEDSENKYGQFQPGKLSENLRHALGLKPNQLPLFIYRMRVLGYPPGWLLDAEVHQADVKMYDGSGKKTGMTKAAEIVFNPPLPEEPLPPPPPLDLPSPPPPPPPPVKSRDVEDGEICEDSQTSLSDLEAKRLKILRELEESTSQTASVDDKCQKDKVSRVTISSNDEQFGENSEDSRMSGNSAADLSHSENSSNDFNENEKKRKRHHRSHSKGFKLGAVIPESSTPYKILPASEKWTVDVSDHINFENLPDALGTWDKMKGVMSKVKKQMLELHDDDDD